METIKQLKRSIFILGCFLVYIVTVTCLGPLKPTAIDYAISRISQRQKEEFVDEHNKYRSSVDPPAANMEYMVWDDDLGNLAQMWANKCTWDHGFLEFGDVYPNAPFNGQVGQNLAREWGRLHIPANRVKLWYKESRNFSFSRVSSSDVRNQCPKPPCKRYTQLVWASTKYVGCGFSFCDKTFGKPHPWVKGETEVVCNYAPGGNVIDHFPYEVGKPCSKCASGNGFCYKNLCRDCDDFDPECGKSLTREMCSEFKEAMAKRCPKMCNLCECPLQCQNGGKLNRLTCTCECSSGWIGLDCSVQCVDKAGQQVCHLRISNGHQCRAPYMKHECATTCRVCGNTPATNPVFGFNNATSKPPVFQQLSQTLADLPNRLPNHGELQTSAIPSSDLPFTQAKTSSMQSLSHSNMTSNKTSSFPPNSPSSSLFNVKSAAVQQPKELFKYMSSKIKSSGKEQVVKCKDDDPKCRMWSVLGICKKKTPTWLKKHCGCGMCNQSQVDNRIELCMDNNVKCPFWASNGECSRDRVWMLRNCRRSCNQCGVCKDAWPNCAEVALQDRCTVGNTTQFMLTHCRQSCGLCQAYDIYDHCPAWAAQSNCKNSNWTWMRDNCPLSCGIPLTEVQYCWDKKDGNYPIPGICTGYVLCSGRLTRHVVCPAGTLFNAVKMICDLPQNIACLPDRPMR